MALALDASTPAFVTGTANPATTGSFSPPAGSLLIALCCADEVNTFSVSGGSLSWTSITSVSGSARPSFNAFWAYAASAPGSMTVSSTKTGSFTANALKVLVFTGTETSFTGASGTATTFTKSLTCTANSSWIWAFYGDDNTGTSATANTGCTFNDALVAFGGISGGILKRTTADGVSGNSLSIGAGSDATATAIIAVEIKPASTSTPAVPIYSLSSYSSYH